MDIIEYTTPEQQIEKLKSQNLIIEDEESAKEILALCGYSNLIKSYREPYMHIKDGKKVYRSGITFEQIYSLYTLDKELRNAVFASMLDLEEHIKEAAADVIASSFGTHPDQYLDYRNYQNKRKSKRRFTLSGIIDKLNETLRSDKDPICHYRDIHGIVPPWILFKSVYFSTITNFIDQFKTREKDIMASKLYASDDIELSNDALRKLMMDTLFICQDYRNLAAHGGRTYNYNSKSRLRQDEIFPPEIELTFRGFDKLIFLLMLLNYTNPVEHLKDVLETQVNRHCGRYPQDSTYLAQILNIDIVPRNIVYVSNGSRKYHALPYCSGMKNPLEVELSEAKENGYIACKRCASNIIPIV